MKAGRVAATVVVAVAIVALVSTVTWWADGQRAAPSLATAAGATPAPSPLALTEVKGSNTTVIRVMDRQAGNVCYVATSHASLPTYHTISCLPAARWVSQ